MSAVLLTVHFNSSTDPVTPPDVVNDPPVLAVNPFEEMTSLEEAGEKVGYEVMSPSYLPDGYETDCISLIFGELVEVTYKNSDGGEITYRTQKTESDVSGDYNSYESTESAELEFDGRKGHGGAEIRRRKVPSLHLEKRRVVVLALIFRRTR